jgi:cytochrome c oxidase cbb3-type subunit IV
MSYDTIRGLADSWGLLAMFAVFVGIVLFAFRPGSKKVYDDVARIPLKEDPKD